MRKARGPTVGSPLQKFDPAKSRWRFVKVAFDLSAPHPAYRHVLLALARYADDQGICYPSHDRLLDDTGYGTKTTIVNALKYWKSAEVLTWKKGWGNAHGRRSNVYQFHYDAMSALSLMKDHSGFDEQPPAVDEQSLATDEQPLGGVGTTTRPNTKVLVVEDSKNKNNPVTEADAGRLPHREKTGQHQSPPEAHAGEQPHSGYSSEQPHGVLSSSGGATAAHAVPMTTLAELHKKLTPDNQRLWYKRTNGEGGAEGRRVALEILATQGAE
jgi:hypothetical protein